jgi:hypothetical protein
MKKDPKSVHAIVLGKILEVQRIVAKEKQALKRAIAEAQVDIDDDTWNEHSRISIFLALKDAQMREYGERLILDEEDEEI